MNNSKWNKILASTIVLSTVFSPLAATATTPTGTQVATTLGDALQQARELGLLVGDPNGEIRPNDRLTRMELAKIICSLFQLKAEQGQAPSFVDVSSDDWGLNYIEAVHRAGLMNGDGTAFRPNDLITREEMAVVLVRGLGLDSTGQGSQLTLADNAQISTWAQDAVHMILELGLMQASDNTFSPQQALIRQEVATVAVGVVDRPTGKVQVSAGTLTIAGITYQVAESLQDLLSVNNAEVLQQAKFELERDGYKIIGIKSLELQQAGVLDAGNNVLNGNLILKGAVTLKNLTAKGKVQVTGNADASTQVILENSTLTSVEAKNSQLIARGTTQVADAVVDGHASITVEGSASFDQLRLAEGSGEVQLKGKLKNVVLLGNAHSKITLAEGASIENLTLPTGVVARDLFNLYDAIKSSIPVVNGSTNVDLIVNVPIEHEQRVNRTALNTKIKEATALKDAAEVGTTPNTYPQAAYDAFVQAIADATAVKNNAATNQTQVNAAVTNLQQAIETFKSSIIVETVDTSALTAKIADAKALKDAAVPGTESGMYPQEAIDALAQVIVDAEAVQNDQMATQLQVNAQVTALQQAITTFTSSVIQDPADVTAALLAKITVATNLRDTAVVGNTTGKYPQSAVDALTQAIASAQAVADQLDVTQDQVVTALGELTQAIATFQQAVLAPLTVTLNPGVRFDVNSNKPGTSGDVLLTDESGAPSGFPYQYNKRNIKNLIKIQRGSEVENIKFNSMTSSFEVDNAQNQPIAEVSVASSSDLIQLVSASNGVTVHPLDDVVETTPAALVLTLKEAGVEVGQQTLPIILDETVPYLTDGSYSSDRFTFTASETVMTKFGIGPMVQVEASEIGDFTDLIVLSNGIDYILNQPVGNQLTIDLTPVGKNKLAVRAGSKFRFTIQGYSDYADNSIDNSQQIVAVDQY